MIKDLAEGRPQPSAVQRYGLAIVFVVAAIAIAIPGGHQLAALSAICAVLITTSYGGVGPGLLAWVVSSLALGCFLTPVVRDAGLDAGDLAAFLASCATAFLAFWISARQRSTAMSESALQAEIANRTRIEASLREGEARLGALAGSSDEVVFESDADGTYLNLWTLFRFSNVAIE